MRELLLDYLAACPDATDSIDGIAEFWLARQKVRIELTLVAEVLADLVAEGRLDAIASGDRRAYRLKASKRDEEKT
jgi:hypothetical protein